MGRATISLGKLGVVDRNFHVLLPGLLRNPGAMLPVSRADHSLLRLLNEAEIRDATPEKALDFLATVRSLWAGEGAVREQDGEIVGEVEWDDTDLGNGTCESVALNRPDWSFGYLWQEAAERTPTDEEKAAGAMRVLTGLTMIELSPVYPLGVGIGNGTLAASCDCESCAGGEEVREIRLRKLVAVGRCAGCGGACQSKPKAADSCAGCALGRRHADPVTALTALAGGLTREMVTPASAAELRRVLSRLGKLTAPLDKSGGTGQRSPETAPPGSVSRAVSGTPTPPAPMPPASPPVPAMDPQSQRDLRATISRILADAHA